MPSNTRADASTPPLPSGTLTFLLTDIEGSTRLWEDAPEAMQAALARHDVILRQSIEMHGGHVFKTAGDAFFAAFTTPGLAVDAALAMQQALQAEAWLPQSPIRVRMALHSGAAELRDGDYFGQALNQVARLLSTGHGGQTLVSSVTCELCKDRLPTGVVLESLGEHLLKDLARRQTIYQLGHPSLPHAFAPLRTLLAPFDTRAPSIAVLPFVNRSHDEEDEYFSDGLADELLNVLARIRGLRVAARSSAFTFKGKGATVEEVGRALNVATVLEGSVRKAGSRMRISVQLVKVADGYHLWSQTYDRTLEDIFAVQDDIAQSVVAELRTTLFGETDAKATQHASVQVVAAAKGRATDPEAHRLFLQGRHFIDRRTREDSARGIGYLKQALEIDPEFALAWVHLARAYATEAELGWVPVAEGVPRARDAVARALALEPDLAEGHAQMGWIQMTYDCDWHAAEASFQRALELAPGNADALIAAGAMALTLGRLDEAIARYRQVVAQDPLRASGYQTLGLALGASDRLAEAEAAYRKTMELAPQREVARAVLSLNLLAQGRGDEALAEVSREPNEAYRLWALAIIEDAAGRRTESDVALQNLIAKYQTECAYQVADVYGARGDADLAFDWLERAYVQRDAGLADTKTDGHLRSLHADPRWDGFLRKMRLAD
jgi:TolB-like protein/class 3 adenylate cyclase/tetratricopeptide (TPR) repeat protein